MEIFAKPLKTSSFQANHNPFSRGRTKIVQMPIFSDIFYKNLVGDVFRSAEQNALNGPVETDVFTIFCHNACKDTKRL